MTVGGTSSRAKGFTLIELIIALAVVFIVITMAVPGMQQFFDGKRLIDTAEQVYSHLQEARLEAIARSDPAGMSVNFSTNGSTTWQYGVSHNPACDLTTTTVTDANACVMVIDDGDGNAAGNVSADAGDLVLMRFTDSEHETVSMGIANFASGTDIRFDPVRGTAEAGDINLTSEDGKQLKVKVGTLGQLRICSPDGSVSGYSTAGC